MGIGMVLAGALQGYGNGLAEKGRGDVAERRAIALENLRSENNQREQSSQYDMMDRNAARQTERQTDSTLITQTNQGKIQTQNQVTIEGVKAANDAALARLKSSLAMTEQQAKASQELHDKMQLLGAEVGDYRVTADGSEVAYSKTGRMLGQTRKGIFNPPNVNTDPLAGIGGTEGATTPPAAPAKPATPASKPTAQKPAGPAAKSYTLAEAKATAAARGIPLSEVNSIMRAAGYKLSQ